MTARVRASSSFRRRVFERLEAVQKIEKERVREAPSFILRLSRFFFELFFSVSPLSLSCLSIFFFVFVIRGRLFFL